MLARYHKSGGFIQLLQLIETSSKAKQENFLGMIEKENFHWADALRTKMVTIEMIFSWDNQVLAEIAVRLQELTIATAMHGLKPADIEKLLSTCSHSQKRIIDDAFKAKVAAPNEIGAAFLKIIQEVRKMISDAALHVEKFAPNLVIEKGIEEKLGKGGAVKGDEASAGAGEAASETPGELRFDSPASRNTGEVSADVSQLQKKVHSLMAENNTLKTELKISKEKLAQIKKIA
jgi:hypothetical protein